MEFEWDEEKRQLLIKERGIDILDAALIFEGYTLTNVDSRKDYGEVRSISLGMVESRCFIVVHTERDGAIRLITAWLGGQRDRAQYQASIARETKKDEAAK